MERKLIDPEAAVAGIADGDVLALGNQKPMALLREIVRQGKKDLTVYVMMGDYDVDLLCGAGCVREIHGLFIVPQAGPHFREGVQSGAIRMVDEGEAPLHLSILAGSMNLPFLPLRGYQNDIVTIHPEWKTFRSPVSDEELLAIKALVPDVALLHMPRSDELGNVQGEDLFVYDRTMAWWDKRIAMAAKRTIVSVEEIIPTDQIRKHPERTVLPFYEVDAVAAAPRGAHPKGLPGSYEADAKHIGLYTEACQDRAAYRAYLEKYIHGPRDNQAYLALVDADRESGALS